MAFIFAYQPVLKIFMVYLCRFLWVFLVYLLDIVNGYPLPKASKHVDCKNPQLNQTGQLKFHSKGEKKVQGFI